MSYAIDRRMELRRGPMCPDCGAALEEEYSGGPPMYVCPRCENEGNDQWGNPCEND